MKFERLLNELHKMNVKNVGLMKIIDLFIKHEHEIKENMPNLYHEFDLIVGDVNKRIYGHDLKGDLNEKR